MPLAAQLLTVQVQGEWPATAVLWARVLPGNAKAIRRITVAGTGHPVPFKGHAPWVATFQMNGLVWHVFDDGETFPVSDDEIAQVNAEKP